MSKTRFAKLQKALVAPFGKEVFDICWAMILI